VPRKRFSRLDGRQLPRSDPDWDRRRKRSTASFCNLQVTNCTKSTAALRAQRLEAGRA
jgi:hypothetical protein